MVDFSPTGKMLKARGIYRRMLAADPNLSNVTLAGLVSDDEPILLRQIYVPLVLTPERVDDEAAEEKVHEGGRGLVEWLTRGPGTGAVRVLSSAQQKGLDFEPVAPNLFFISGEAGSGKTTLTRSIVVSLAGSAADSFNRRFEGYIPIPILLREADLDQLDGLEALVDWWLEEIQRRHRKRHPDEEDFDAEALKAFLEAGRGIFVLDGLDEVGDLKNRRKILRWLLEHRWVRTERDGGHANLVLVTARPSGFEGLKERKFLQPTRLHVAPFSKKQIREYLVKWFELRPLPPQRRKENVEDLVERLTSEREKERLRPLARRPAYLAALAFIHGTRGALPNTRANLYETLVDAYLEALDRHKGLLGSWEEQEEIPAWDRQEKLEVLSAVAFQAHVGATQDPQRRRKPSNRRFVWSREELEEAVRQAIAWGEARFRNLQQEHAKALTDYFVARTGLLVESEEGHYQFAHLSIQEYLTALFILNQAAGSANKDEELATRLFPLLEEQGWQEVALLLMAIDASRTGGTGHRALLPKLDLSKRGALTFLGAALREQELRLTKEEIRGWLLVWIAAWASFSARGWVNPGPVLTYAPHRPTVKKVWEAAYRSVAEGHDPIVALQELVPREDSPARREEKSSNPLAMLGGATELEPVRRNAEGSQQVLWHEFLSSHTPETVDQVSARLLVLPILGGFVQELDNPEAAFTKAIESRAAAWADMASAPSSWWAFLSWSRFSPSLTQILATASPLLFWLAEEELPWFLFLSDTKPSDLLASWRFNTWKIWNLAESASWKVWMDLKEECRMEDLPPLLSAIVLGNRGQAQDFFVDLPQARARTRNLIRNRDRDWTQALDRARDRARAQDWSHDSAQDWKQTLALIVDAARNLDRAQDRARDLGQNRDRDRNWDRARGLTLAVRRTPQTTSLQVLENFSVKVSTFFVEQSSALLDVTQDAPFTRAKAEALLVRFQDPEAMAADLPTPELRQQAAEEWKQVLDSPFSPVPLLHNALKAEWEEIDLSKEAVLDRFEQGLNKFITEAERVLEEAGIQP